MTGNLEQGEKLLLPHTKLFISDGNSFFSEAYHLQNPLNSLGIYVRCTSRGKSIAPCGTKALSYSGGALIIILFHSIHDLRHARL